MHILCDQKARQDQSYPAPEKEVVPLDTLPRLTHVRGLVRILACLGRALGLPPIHSVSLVRWCDATSAKLAGLGTSNVDFGRGGPFRGHRQKQSGQYHRIATTPQPREAFW